MDKEMPNVLKQGNDWRKLHFYHKADAIYPVSYTHLTLPTKRT